MTRKVLAEELMIERRPRQPVTAVAISRTRRGMTLSGHLRDGAHLHGVILHLTGLGLQIRTVQQTDDEPSVGPRNPCRQLPANDSKRGDRGATPMIGPSG